MDPDGSLPRVLERARGLRADDATRVASTVGGPWGVSSGHEGLRAADPLAKWPTKKEWSVDEGASPKGTTWRYSRVSHRCSR